MQKTTPVLMLTGCISSLQFLALSPPAHADMTVNSEVRVVRPSDPSQNQSGTTPPEETRSSTVYYQGDRARVEQSDGTITLYDLKAGRVYLLIPADKTYSTLSVSDYLKRDPFPMFQDVTGHTANMKMAIRMDLKKDAVLDPKSLAGMQAQAYDLTGNIVVSPNAPANNGGSRFPGGGGGGRHGRRGGGFPSRGGNPGGNGNLPSPNSGEHNVQPTRITSFTGEIWLSAPNALKTKISWVPLLQLGVPSTQLIQPLAEKITKAKGFPLACKVTVGNNNALTAPSLPSSVTIYSTVKIISEAPLEATLFKIPADYQRQDARSFRQK